MSESSSRFLTIKDKAYSRLKEAVHKLRIRVKEFPQGGDIQQLIVEAEKKSAMKKELQFEVRQVSSALSTNICADRSVLRRSCLPERKLSDLRELRSTHRICRINHKQKR